MTREVVQSVVEGTASGFSGLACVAFLNGCLIWPFCTGMALGGVPVFLWAEFAAYTNPR